MGKTKISWSEFVWNPIAGCNDVSEGCRNCYARGMAKRLEAMGSEKYKGLTVMQGSHNVWTGKISFDEKALMAPLARKKPTVYFANSMSDLFHPNVTDEMRDRIFAVIFLTPRHTYQILTKRPETQWWYFSPENPRYTARRICDAAEKLQPGLEVFDCDLYFPLINAWLGTSTENQKAFDERVPYLAATDASLRFLSVEPMLEEINTRKVITPHGWKATSNALAGIGWVICGGESGHHARPMHPDWACRLRDDVLSSGIPFFFKQFGEWTPGENVERSAGIVQTATWFDNKWLFSEENLANDEGHHDDEPDLYRVGKKEAGAFLDGKEYHQYPRIK